MAKRKHPTQNCPYCGEQILASAQKCKFCGEWLTDKPFYTNEPNTIIKQALFQKYEIIEEIGRGGMATVYKAIQKSLHRPVALKILLPQFTEDQEFLERFHREAQAAAKINHPNIVTIYEEGVENGVHYISMEYINGKDLRNIIKQNGTISIIQIKKWLIPIIEGLGYAHRQGLIHRDIKSSNILIDDKDRAILTDFGIVRSSENTHLTQTGTVLGTPEYMSPEQARGEQVDARSDIYSLGVVLYECLTGRVPFKSDTIFGTIHKIAYEAPIPPRLIYKQIPLKMENVILRCLAKNFAERYQSCEELSAALKQGESKRVLHKWNENKHFLKTRRTSRMVGAAFGLFVIALLVISGIIVKQSIMVNYESSKNLNRNEKSGAKFTQVKKNDISSLLKKADRLFYVNNQIFSPPGNNAFELYQKVLGIQPGNKHAWAQIELIRKDFLQLARDAFVQKNYGKALQITRTALKHFKQDAELSRIRNLSKIKILENKAKQLAKNEKFINPVDNNAYNMSQKILLLDTQNKIAQQVLKKIENWFVVRGAKAEEQKDWKKAVSIYDKAIRYFGPQKFFIQKLKLARKALGQQQISTDKLKGKLTQAKNLIDQKQFSLAWQLYNEILTINPGEESAQKGKQQIIKTLEFEARQSFNTQNFGKAQKLYQLLNTFRPSINYLQKADIAAKRQKWLNLIDWVWIEGGSFKMGCNDGQNECEYDERPVHKVTVNGFFMSRYEITIAQFENFVKDTNYRTLPEVKGYSWIWNGEWYKKKGMNWKLDSKGNKRPRRDYDHPVTHVSWNDAMAFCKWLSQKTGTIIRLPTEAEWEYAARGGGFANAASYTKYAGSNDINAVAWYFNNSGNHTHPVGQKLPNALDLYDLSGNVWEWCLDWYNKNYYTHSPHNNPKKLAAGIYRVVRGGCWDTDMKYVRIANRFYGKPPFSSDDLGFRVVRIR